MVEQQERLWTFDAVEAGQKGSKKGGGENRASKSK